VSTKHQSNGRQFVSIGDYTPPDAERLLDALTRAHIEFQVECDDGIRPDFLQRGFGEYAKVRVFVDHEKLTEVGKIQEQLFGPPT
jgi:hypothetical protein